MSLTILRKTNLSQFVAGLLPHYRVGGPVKFNGSYAFKDIQDPEDLRLDYPTTILPPKKYLLPVRETLFSFDHSTGSITEAELPPPTVLFGVHTCDLHAIQLLDRVFTRGHIDPNYVKRRKQTLIISLECLNPCDEHSFCKSMGTLTADEGYDIHMIDLGDAYILDAISEEGQNLLKHAPVEPVTPKDMQRMNTVLNEKWSRFPYRLDFDVSELSPLLTVSMKSPLWEELGQRCLGCAACTIVCPTCFCFDVKDETDLTLTRGERARNWDSCQLDDFATVAGGHNFRQSKALRQRHRFMRKGKYILAAHEYLGCVGCGRCARACLVDITPVKVFNELYHQREAGGRS
ncbi:MAG: 4Fe-4S dicluster domain-containing protein [Anaerolineales bacterium]|nr:4Fe-4S dicluster domain-containing protein [Anaerolineales bacterium]